MTQQWEGAGLTELCAGHSKDCPSYTQFLMVGRAMFLKQTSIPAQENVPVLALALCQETGTVENMVVPLAKALSGGKQAWLV